MTGQLTELGRPATREDGPSRVSAPGPGRFFPGAPLACGGPRNRDGNVSLKAMPVFVHEVATGKLLRRLDGHPSGLCAAVFAPDGKTLAAGAEDGTVML
jgi:WD40 repeat protein